MLENIIVILLVIGLSYLFRQNSDDTFNTQMLFILLTLGGIIFYKIIYLHHYVKDKEMFVVDREPFENNLNNVLNTFSSGSNEIKESEYEENKGKILQLETKFSELQNAHATLLSNQNNTFNEGNMDYTNMENMSMSELKNLESEIKQIDIDIQENNKKKYKKIPIYNSCIIEATGEKTNIDNSENEPEKSISEEDISKLQEYSDIIQKKDTLLNKYESIVGQFKNKLDIDTILETHMEKGI